MDGPNLLARVTYHKTKAVLHFPLITRIPGPWKCRPEQQNVASYVYAICNRDLACRILPWLKSREQIKEPPLTGCSTSRGLTFYSDLVCNKSLQFWMLRTLSYDPIFLAEYNVFRSESHLLNFSLLPLLSTIAFTWPGWKAKSHNYKVILWVSSHFIPLSCA